MVDGIGRLRFSLVEGLKYFLPPLIGGEQRKFIEDLLEEVGVETEGKML